MIGPGIWHQRREHLLREAEVRRLRHIPHRLSALIWELQRRIGQAAKRVARPRQVWREPTG